MGRGRLEPTELLSNLGGFLFAERESGQEQAPFKKYRIHRHSPPSKKRRY